MTAPLDEKGPKSTRRIEMVGRRFERLTVLSFAGHDKHLKRRYACRCDCGQDVVVRGSDLREGKTRSCGCLLPDLSLKHGGHDTPEYKIWTGMKSRCSNPRLRSYQWYGARGIRVCDEWNDFSRFFADMGPRPSPKHSIDRINNDGNYEPGNCRWATAKQQANNKRQANQYRKADR